MSDTSAGGAPAGWYQDGVTAGQERYWDGTQWTDQFRPLPVPAAPPAPAAPAEPVAPAAPAEPVAAAPAYQPYQPAAESAQPTAQQAYPAYQPAQPGPVVPRKGLSTGAIIGIVAGIAAAVIVAIVLILGFTVWGWAGGGAAGGASGAQQQTYLSHVKGSGASGASDAALVDAGNKLCDAGRTIVAGDYLGGMTKYLDLFNTNLDLVTLGSVSMYAMQDLCPDVQAKLEELGQTFDF